MMTKQELEFKKVEDLAQEIELVKNPNAPKKALIELSKDEQYYVRVNVSRNPNTPPEALMNLSDSKEAFIIDAILGREDLDPLIRLKLTTI